MSQARFSDDDELPKLESIINALKCEQTGHIMEAILLYEESIYKLNQMATAEPNKKQLCGKYLKMYEARAKQLRDQVKTHLHSSKMLDRISIERDARGRSYQRLFGPYLDDNVKEAHLNEPHLTEQNHFKNLLNFFEVLVKNCRYLKYIRLTTRPDPVVPQNQIHILQKIRADLGTGNIHMNFQLDDTLHDRKIVLSSGVVIKIGRGLHYFEPQDNEYTLGQCDFDFRKCLATEVDIWKCRAFAKKPKELRDRDEYHESSLKEEHDRSSAIARAYSSE
ncbi:MIT domain-containing protein 1 [Scaptodrosophila lebanonensis]|uniref:MIT domain-containing protein 1 n=1 Tax=Drosophila lebanonensis TaxID=7225 RepID=A0A6J2TF09_DROLE|nr:MIT domain-containing protein 1 [Scaptodrosophila lebanonensis]